MTTITTPATTLTRKVLPKPEKPFPEFPLYWHPRGYWMCKRDGEEWRYEADSMKSYDRFRKDEDAWKAGANAPTVVRKRYLLRDAVNAYLTRQKQRMEDGSLSAVQFTKCRLELQIMLPKAVAFATPLANLRASGPDDAGPATIFRRIRKRAEARGLSVAHRHVTLVRAMLAWAAERKLMLPPDYSDDFDPPTQSSIDTERHKTDLDKGERAWTVEELRKILAAAEKLGEEYKTAKGKIIRRNPHLYAQVLLGLFAGFGSDDCSAVPERAFNREQGTVKFPRVKNGRPRIVALPKVVWDAIELSLAHRAGATSPDAEPLLFRTSGGKRCNVANSKSDESGILAVGRNDTIGKNFQRMVKRLGVARHRAGFKTLRAMCRTLLVGSGVDEDLIAVVMGRRFRYAVDDYYLRGDLRAKLFKLAGHIEAQLFPKQTRSRPRDASGAGAAVKSSVSVLASKPQPSKGSRRTVRSQKT